jgi:hypothetical protein
MQVFDRNIDDDMILIFGKSEDGNSIVDIESGSEWSVTGECKSGHYAGSQLSPIAHYNKIFWYVWSDYFPGGEIFGVPHNVENISASVA